MHSAHLYLVGCPSTAVSVGVCSVGLALAQALAKALAQALAQALPRPWPGAASRSNHISCKSLDSKDVSSRDSGANLRNKHCWVP